MGGGVPRRGLDFARGPREQDLAPDAGAALAAPGTTTTPRTRACSSISRSTSMRTGVIARRRSADGHARPRSPPPAIVERVAALPRVRTTVELGCSTGRILAELARSRITSRARSVPRRRATRRAACSTEKPFLRAPDRGPALPHRDRSRGRSHGRWRRPHADLRRRARSAAGAARSTTAWSR